MKEKSKSPEVYVKHVPLYARFKAICAKRLITIKQGLTEAISAFVKKHKG